MRNIVLWTSAMDEVVKASAKKGHSAGVIAHELSVAFGLQFTRNAVIGRANRKGIDLAFKKTVTVPVAEKKKVAVKPRPKPKTLDRDLTPDERIWGSTKFINPEARAVAFLELERHHCRFPIGEIKKNTLRFCGADRDITDPHPYCEYCRKLCYYPPRVPITKKGSSNGSRQPAR